MVHTRSGAITRRAVVTALAVFSTVGCRGDAESLEWTLPVPLDVSVIAAEAIPFQHRTQRIELIEDLRLGDDPGGGAEAFYRARDVDADAAGNIYVLDAGNYRVQVYDAEGGYVRTLGRRGQGPAELERPRGLVVAGDLVAVKTYAELSAWTLEGTHRGDYRNLAHASNIFGRADGTYVADNVPDRDTDPLLLHVSAFSMEGALLIDYLALPLAPNLRPAPTFAAARDGAVYVTAVDEYEVLAFASDGDVRWALRVAWPRLPSEQVADLDSNRMELPESAMPALSHIAVDGHGHLYVYPYHPSGGAAAGVPVDVYAPDGERLFAGLIDNVRWLRSRGDHVYRTEFDQRTEEQSVVRYRLSEPF